MAMTPKLWSINALATEFGVDRRTVAARLRDVPPAGQRRGHPAWRLADVADRLVARPRRISSTGEVIPPPSDLDRLNSVANPVACGLALMAVALVRRTGAVTAAMAVGAGATLRTAYATQATTTATLVNEANRLAESLGLDPFAFDDDDFDAPNWNRLAEIAGEDVVDEVAWFEWIEQWLATDDMAAVN